ncbi:tetratricopeptide repeat protein [Thermostilla marina]
MRRSKSTTAFGISGGILLLVCLVTASGCSGITAQGLNAEGVRLYRQSHYDAAIERFEKATALDPRNADAYYNLASTYHQLGKLKKNPAYFAQAEQYYHRCLDYDPNHTACYRALAVLLVEQGKSQAAFRLLQNWMVQNPGSPEPKIELARLCEEFGEIDAAENHLLSALAIDNTNARALAALGHIRELNGHTIQALENYQRSLMYDERQPLVAMRVAALQSHLGLSGQASLPNRNETRLSARADQPLRY